MICIYLGINSEDFSLTLSPSLFHVQLAKKILLSISLCLAMKKSVAVVEKRICYLFQLAHQCITAKDMNKELCRYHVRSLKRIAMKNVIRLHTDIKRKICKKCDMLLHAGITAKVRLSRKPNRAVTVQCLECKNVKKFPCSNPDYKIWIEKCQNVQDS
ncbi:uncharacterized protein LOC125669887 [Ostrea edulis]|uniref:uncharacterized protein LOC125669887 n=1 Tax=Ostrea edulis TaxID=37623 RepID=UPI0024AF1164|nr:uncharacterized protein LOC125669887 [Ostrea edulis]